MNHDSREAGQGPFAQDSELQERKSDVERKKYKLVGHEAVPVKDLLEWAQWMETAERHVADTKVGDVRVSTVFLGLDHSFGGEPLLLFETMIFGGSLNDEMDRYTTWEQAEAGHRAWVERVQQAESVPSPQGQRIPCLVSGQRRMPNRDETGGRN